MNAKKPRIVVFGSLNFDYVMWAARLPKKGETIRGNRFGTFIGGKGANQAVQAARLGAQTYMIGRIGSDIMGESVMKSLLSNGVKTDYLKIDPEKGTGTACIMVDDQGENYLMITSEANGNCQKWDLDDAIEVIKSADVLITQLETTMEMAKYALELAKDNNVKTILNPAPTVEVPKSIFEIADIITPNETEAEFHSGIRQTADLNEWSNKVYEKFRCFGVEEMIMTLGKKGAFIGTENEKTIINAYSGINAVDSTAAGDSFNAALAVALAEGKTLGDAVRFANAAGALTVSAAGAQSSLPSRQEVEEFILKYKER